MLQRAAHDSREVLLLEQINGVSILLVTSSLVLNPGSVSIDSPFRAFGGISRDISLSHFLYFRVGSGVETTLEREC